MPMCECEMFKIKSKFVTYSGKINARAREPDRGATTIHRNYGTCVDTYALISHAKYVMPSGEPAGRDEVPTPQGGGLHTDILICTHAAANESVAGAVCVFVA